MTCAGRWAYWRGYAAMLEQQEDGRLDDSQREMLAAIQRSTRRLARTADALTVLADLEQGASAPICVDTSVAEWLPAVIAAQNRSVALDADESAETWVAIRPGADAAGAGRGVRGGGRWCHPSWPPLPARRGRLDVRNRRAGAPPDWPAVFGRRGRAGPASETSGRRPPRPLAGLLATRIVEAHGGTTRARGPTMSSSSTSPRSPPRQ